MLPIKLSNRARQTPPSPIRSLAHLADRAAADGTKIFYLNIGQPDIASPKEFLDGLRMFNDPIVAYERSKGNRLLCQAWSEHINRSLGLLTRPEQFLITTGASEALVFLFMTCCDPGDEVIIFDPTYANYMGFAALAGIDLVPVASDMEHNFVLPPLEEIEEKITNRTRAILLCSPNNPTGTVYTREEVQFLIDLCDEHNIFLIVDETYREFVYDGLKPLSVLHLAPNNKRVLVVDSLSKRYSLCGARIGCILTCNEEVLATTLNIAQARLAAPTVEQAAAVHMLNHISDDYVDTVRREYQSRRDALLEALSAIPGVGTTSPKGAFYTLVRLPVEDAAEFAKFMLSDFAYNGKTTFIAPAAGFYMQNAKGKQKIRIAYVLNCEQIKEAIEVLGEGLKDYQNRD